MARAANYCFMVTLQKKPSPESDDPELSFLRKNNSTAFTKPRYFDGEMLSLIFVGQFASSSRKLIYSRKSCVSIGFYACTLLSTVSPILTVFENVSKCLIFTIASEVS